MAADVIKAAQLTLSAAHQQQRLAQKVGGEEVAGLQQLLAMPNHLPGAGKDAISFPRAHLRVGIEDRRNRPGPGNVSIDLNGR